jgi:hypothetical protein
VTHLTEVHSDHGFNRDMSPAIAVAFVFLVGGANALRRGRRHDLITPRPYNNLHSDASGARDEQANLLS